MSVVLDDYCRDIIETANGKRVLIDTRYVPWPLGRGYETMVFPCTVNGKPNYKKELDVQTYGNNKVAADEGHTDLVNKWMKEVLA